MATLKEKFSGDRGVYAFMLKKIEKIKNPFGCYFEITEADLVTDLLEMGVRLQHFLDVLRPMSRQVEADENEGIPFAVAPEVSDPKAYFCEPLNLRWSIRYSEDKATYVEDPLRGAQFEPEFDHYRLNFGSLGFHFYDRDLLVSYLEEKYRELTRDENKIYRDKSTLLTYKNKTYHLKTTKIPFALVRLAWENEGLVRLSELSKISGSSVKKCATSARNFKDTISKKFNIKPPERLLEVRETEDEIRLNPEVFSFPKKS